ncbi:hypothetical protein E2562_025773 [Oryza meyeriana var. granulata]|uniref:Uncharacterized protein n=1 Tax=Oryza meyeriana var. granulata TaxID=110450 RepID=A0A6G1CT09_9ORYZ|nr:hypothetical protein E2562_025773 [Oryza meyeriana var. granulata]
MYSRHVAYQARNNQLDTPLICAARAGHVDVVDYLIRASAMQEAQHPVMRAWNSGGATAMHEAVRNGYALVLQTLMSRDSGLVAMVDDKGVSLLYLAVVSNRADMVDILIRESSDGMRSLASYAGPDGKTALHAAVYFGKVLLHIPENDGLLPVHVATIAGKASVTRYQQFRGTSSYYGTPYYEGLGQFQQGSFRFGMAGDPSSPVDSGALFGGIGGSGSHGDKSGSPISVPQPTHGVPVIDEEQSESSPEEENQKSGRRLWSKEENLRLVRVWLNNSNVQYKALTRNMITIRKMSPKNTTSIHPKTSEGQWQC